MILDYLIKMTTMIRNLNRKEIKYHSIEEFVYKNGKFFEISNKRVKHKKMKECFKNAFHLAEESNYTYVEGYATSLGIGIPVLHAWCLDEDGKVVDPTWTNGDEYYGVLFDMDYVRSIILEREIYGVIDNWEMGFPLLKGTHTEFSGGLHESSKQNSRKRYAANIPKLERKNRKNN